MSEDVNGYVDETLPGNIGTILHEFSLDDRKTVRSLENLGKKQNNARYAVIFIETCIRENLLPNFTRLIECKCIVLCLIGYSRINRINRLYDHF